MTLLIISPDYASHLYPLATLGTEWQRGGERVVVATGHATKDIVAEFGFEWVELIQSRGSNPGVIKAEDQPKGEDDALRGFFDATYRGMVETLTFQARARSNDLLWNPVLTGAATQRVVAEVRPDHIIVDHLAFGARIGLVSAGIPYADVVLGNPSALPVGDEVYGYPSAWPAALTPDVGELADLFVLNTAVSDAFTAQWNDALLTLDPFATPTTDAFRETGDLLLLNYPEELHDPERTAALPPHAFLGSAVRNEAEEPEVRSWINQSDDPVVYVSFGSFLSVRGDVLAVVVDALRTLPVRVALATGSSDPATLGDIPSSWLVRGFLPQVALLDASAVAISHGGNNSVTEAVTAGVPLVVLPFSTDQFAGAAAVENAGIGAALDPNTATADNIRRAVASLLEADPDTSARLSRPLRRTPGPARAYDALHELSARATR